MKRFHLNQYPSVVTADTIEQIKAFCFPPTPSASTVTSIGSLSISSAASSMISSSSRARRPQATDRKWVSCYELFTVHRKTDTANSGNERIHIVESAKRLASKLWTMSGRTHSTPLVPF